MVMIHARFTFTINPSILSFYLYQHQSPLTFANTKSFCAFTINGSQLWFHTVFYEHIGTLEVPKRKIWIRLSSFLSPSYQYLENPEKPRQALQIVTNSLPFTLRCNTDHRSSGERGRVSVVIIGPPCLSPNLNRVTDACKNSICPWTTYVVRKFSSGSLNFENRWANQFNTRIQSPPQHCWQLSLYCGAHTLPTLWGKFTQFCMKYTQ